MISASGSRRLAKGVGALRPGIPAGICESKPSRSLAVLSRRA